MDEAEFKVVLAICADYMDQRDAFRDLVMQQMEEIEALRLQLEELRGKGAIETLFVNIDSLAQSKKIVDFVMDYRPQLDGFETSGKEFSLSTIVTNYYEAHFSKEIASQYTTEYTSKLRVAVAESLVKTDAK